MRSYTREKRLDIPSLAEIRRGVRDEAERLADEHGMTGGGTERSRGYNATHLVNDLVCWYLARPEPDRVRIAREGSAITERLRASDRPAAIEPAGPPDDAGSIDRGWTPARDLGPADEGQRQPEQPKHPRRRRRNGMDMMPA